LLPCAKNVLVVDASVIAPAVADHGRDGDACRHKIVGQVLAAPDLMRVEAVSVIRRRRARGEMTARQAKHAIDDLMDLPITVYPTASLLVRGWEMRANVTSYDACYIALAEALGCTFATAERRLASRPCHSTNELR
jgi:predicted nucleic acid-binding protein